MNDDPRRHSAAAERNRDPIAAQWLRLMPAEGVALEIAAGTGQHAAHLAGLLPGWHWWPTDAEGAALPSIDAWCRGLPNVAPAQQLDVMADAWPGVPASVDAIYCANLLHIAPWPVCGALMRGAARHLVPQGRLLTYGPYVEDDVPTADSNRAFDADLRQRNPAWGLRRRADVADEAQAAGLRLVERVAMPANNLLLVWGR